MVPQTVLKLFDDNLSIHYVVNTLGASRLHLDLTNHRYRYFRHEIIALYIW